MFFSFERRRKPPGGLRSNIAQMIFHFAWTYSSLREGRRFVSQWQRIHFAKGQEGPFRPCKGRRFTQIARAGDRFMLPKPTLHFARMKEKDTSCQKFSRRNRRSRIFANGTHFNLVPLVNQPRCSSSRQSWLLASTIWMIFSFEIERRRKPPGRLRPNIQFTSRGQAVRFARAGDSLLRKGRARRFISQKGRRGHSGGD